MIRVLITGAGGAGTIAIIESLNKIGGYNIIAVDANPYAKGLRIADKGFIVPMGNQSGFGKIITDILDDWNPQYIIPLVDEEILVFHSLAGNFPIKILTPSVSLCEIFLDKWKTYEFLKKNGLPVPETWLPSKFSRIDIPIIVKPKNGHGSKGQTYFDKSIALYENKIFSDDYIFQEKIEGKEFTISVIVGLSGKLLSIVPKEVIIKKGITMVGITRYNPEIISLCEELVYKLNPNGPLNVQLIIDKKGDPIIFEINPRYSTTVALTIAAGVNEIDAVISHEEGKIFPIPIPFTANLEMIRYYTQDYVLETQ